MPDINQTLFEIVNYLLKQHPKLAPTIEVIAGQAQNRDAAVLSQLKALELTYLNSTAADSSYAGEYLHLRQIFSALSIEKGFVVDIAASDGVTQSCTLGLFRDASWSGLAVEMEPINFSKLSFVYSKFANAKLARCRVTPKNVASLLAGFEVPVDFTFLNLDIDSYDLYVIDQLLRDGYKPTVISMEINEKIPPPIFFTVEYEDTHSWQGDHFFGCSLTAAAEVVKPFGYILESLQYNNAIFIRSDLAVGLISDTPVEIAYAAGYKNKPDRTKLFPWNSNVDCLLTMSTSDSLVFIADFFKKYHGRFTLR